LINYCSTEHQKKDWNIHRGCCVPVPLASEELLKRQGIQVRWISRTRGRGLFSTTCIPESAALILPKQVFFEHPMDFSGAESAAERELIEEQSAHKFAVKLFENDRARAWLPFLMRTKNLDAEKVYKFVLTNGFIHSSKSGSSWLVNTLSTLANHGCLPNATSCGDGALKSIKPISAGEEITISYMCERMMLPRSIRHEFLYKRVGIVSCSCVVCVAGESHPHEQRLLARNTEKSYDEASTATEFQQLISSLEPILSSAISERTTLKTLSDLKQFQTKAEQFKAKHKLAMSNWMVIQLDCWITADLLELLRLAVISESVGVEMLKALLQSRLQSHRSLYQPVVYLQLEWLLTVLNSVPHECIEALIGMRTILPLLAYM
jgi:hypothetical protein